VDIRPIKTNGDYEAALAEIERRWGAKPGTPEGDKLDVLATLVDAYEDVHFPIDPPTPIEAIKFRMDQMGLRQIDLVPYFGSRGRVSEVLNGKRPLSLRMIRRISRGLGIPTEVLIQEKNGFDEKNYRLTTPAETEESR